MVLKINKPDQPTRGNKNPTNGAATKRGITPIITQKENWDAV